MGDVGFEPQESPLNMQEQIAGWAPRMGYMYCISLQRAIKAKCQGNGNASTVTVGMEGAGKGIQTR